MKEILKENSQYVLCFERGEELIGKLEDFCRKENIKSAFLLAVGATQEVELSWYNLEKKEYENKELKDFLEIISLSGNIAKMGEKIIIHIHGVFSNKDFQMIAGHIKKLVVSATCEVFLITFENEIQRKYSKDIGLNLMEGI